MKITFNKLSGNEYEIKMVGRLDECGVVVEALENSVTDNRAATSATGYLRKKLNEHTRKK